MGFPKRLEKTGAGVSPAEKFVEKNREKRCERYPEHFTESLKSLACAYSVMLLQKRILLARFTYLVCQICGIQ